MSDQLSRSPRTMHVADHLWDTYALMSAEMGVDRDGLVNQALFAFARGHGYLTPGSARTSIPPPAAPPVSAPAPVAPTPAPAPSFAPVEPTPAPAFTPAELPSMPPEVAFEQPAAAPEFTPPAAPSPLAASRAVPEDATPPSVQAPTPLSTSALDDPDPKATAAIRVRPAVEPAPPPPVASDPGASDDRSQMSPEEVRAAQERVLQKAAELEKLVRGDTADEQQLDEALAADVPVEPEDTAAAAEPTLVLYAEGREVDRVTNARFLIGRGKHCDLIINSGKVSREHAAIMREGDLFFIEDLGSSNGTWYDKKRITRRRVEDGDEYFVCSEKLTCRLDH